MERSKTQSKKELTKQNILSSLFDLLNNYVKQSKTKTSEKENFCLILENIIYNKLENFKDESEMKYKRIKQKQLSLEQEKRLEEEISKRLSGIDQLLSKALSFNPSIFNDENKQTNKDEQKTISKEEKQLDLYELYRSGNIITKCVALTKLKETKKTCRAQIKQLIQTEDNKKSFAFKRIKKLGQLTRNSRQAKSNLNSNQIQNDIKILCKACIDKIVSYEYLQKFFKTDLQEQYINRLFNGNQDLMTQFNDYYALWVINKKINEQHQIYKQAEIFVQQKLPFHIIMLKNTFIIGGTLILRNSVLHKQVNENEILEVCEEELLEQIRLMLKLIKPNITNQSNTEQLVNTILTNKDVLKLSRLLKKVVVILDLIKFNEVKIQVLNVSLMAIDKSKIKVNEIKELIRINGVMVGNKLKHILIITQ